MTIEDTIFTTTTLLDGRKCEILDVKFRHISMASFKQLIDIEKKYDWTAYFFQQILRIGGEKQSLDDLGDLSIDDYVSINEILEVVLNKLPKL